MDNKKGLYIELDDLQYKKLKMYAVKNNTSVKKVIEGWIDKYARL